MAGVNVTVAVFPVTAISSKDMNKVKHTLNRSFLLLLFFFFFLTFSLLIGWQFYVLNCCKPLFPLLYNCQLLCFWRLALSIAVQVFPQPFYQILFLQGCLLQTRYA